ncbi:hypothetical protein ACTXGQ_36225, partial [Marinobacter sp. 1Y8]
RPACGSWTGAEHSRSARRVSVVSLQKPRDKAGPPCAMANGDGATGYPNRALELLTAPGDVNETAFPIHLE